MIIVIECIVLCVVFTLMVYIMSRNPIATLYNYPPKIQERVKSLEEYKDKIPTTQNKVAAKLCASIIIVILVSVILRYIKGTEDMIKEYRNYWFHIGQGFIGQVIGTVICVIIGLVVGGIL